LYKRGKFAEALVYFERAIGPAARPDPVVLDHMGDVLYQLSRGPDAMKQWKRAEGRLNDMGELARRRDDLKTLGLKLKQKLEQAQGGKPVEVAPVVEAQAASAKN
jgi:hypothetical protein